MSGSWKRSRIIGLLVVLLLAVAGIIWMCFPFYLYAGLGKQQLHDVNTRFSIQHTNYHIYFYEDGDQLRLMQLIRYPYSAWGKDQQQSIPIDQDGVMNVSYYDEEGKEHIVMAGVIQNPQGSSFSYSVSGDVVERPDYLEHQDGRLYFMMEVGSEMTTFQHDNILWDGVSAS